MVEYCPLEAEERLSVYSTACFYKYFHDAEDHIHYEVEDKHLLGDSVPSNHERHGHDRGEEQRRHKKVP